MKLKGTTAKMKRLSENTKNKSKKIALVPMSAKPYHAGHDGLVRIAADECDEVHLFVSLSDRKRPGELPILGSSMEVLWKSYIEPSLPGNVIVTYGGSPVGNLYKELGQASETNSPNTYVIYSDVEDILQYTDSALQKYAPTLFTNNRIELRGVERTETVNVSGTKMRAMLAAGDAKGFAKNLPTALQSQAAEIIRLLSNGQFATSAGVKSGKKSKVAMMPESLRAKYHEDLVRRTVRKILREETTAGVRDSDSPFGVSFSGTSTQKLINIFTEPFIDALKVGVAGAKEMGVRLAGLLEISIKTILSSFFPSLRYKHDKIFKKEERRLGEIKKKYKDVYDRIDSSMQTSDFPLFAFMASPSLFMSYKGSEATAKIGKKASLDLLSIISGGYSDKLIELAKEKYRGFDDWMLRGTEFGSEAERRRRERRKESGRIRREESLAIRYATLLEKREESDLVDEKKESEFEEILKNIFEKSLVSPAAQEMRDTAKTAYRDSLSEIYSQAETVLEKMKGIDDLEKFLGSESNAEVKTEIEKIKKLEPQQKKTAEEQLIKGIRESTKEFYVQDLSSRIKAALSQGVSEKSQYIKDYEQTLENIKKL
jgi:hypothetical protein